jgi:DNA replication protein DnaC
MEESKNKFKKQKEDERISEGLKYILENFGEEFDIDNIKKLHRISYKFHKNILAYKQMSRFAKNLEEKYGRDKCMQSLAYHILIGSTPDKKSITFFDFDGEDSISKFAENLIKNIS